MELDQHFSWAKQSILNIMDDPENKTVSYIRHEDLCKSYTNSTLLVVQAPSGTQLEVPTVDDDLGHGVSLLSGGGDGHRGHLRKGRGQKYQMHLKSRSGPITVSLVNRDQTSAQPVVTQVPPDDLTGLVREVGEGDGEAMDVTVEEEEVAKPLAVAKKQVDSSTTSVLEPVVSQSAATRSGTRSSARGASKATIPTPPTPILPAAIAIKEEKKPIAVAKEPEAVVQPTTSLRQLSPRKAAQKHLFVQHRQRGQPGQTIVPPLSPSKPTRKEKALAAASSAAAAAASNEDETEQTDLATTGEEQVTSATDTTSGGRTTTDQLIPNNENKAINNTVKVVRIAGQQALQLQQQRVQKRPYAQLEDVPADVLQPFLRLSPPANGRDYCFNLDASEGAADLFGAAQWVVVSWPGSRTVQGVDWTTTKIQVASGYWFILLFNQIAYKIKYIYILFFSLLWI